MSAKLFEYAIIWHPTEQQVEDGQSSRIIQNPEVCLANDEKIVAIKAARSIPEEYVDALEQIEVVIKPWSTKPLIGSSLTYTTNTTNTANSNAVYMNAANING